MRVLFFSGFLALFLLPAGTLDAQMERTVYQAFEIDSAATITLDLVGFTEVEIKAWAGNTILSEANIQLWEASPEILNYFVENGRYKFGFEKKGDDVSITTQVRERKVIKTKLSGPSGCQEISTLRLFVPENYQWTDQLEGDSDGSILESKDGYLLWRSGYTGSSGEESFEERNKHKILKTLQKKS
jgi:hypothetical protein